MRYTESGPLQVARTMKPLDEQALSHVSDYFQALAEPQRLKLLNALSDGAHNVNELTELLHCSQANVSKHLGVLMRLGFVSRDQRGTAAYYQIADASVYQLCDLVCGRIAERLQEQLATVNQISGNGIGSSKPSKATQAKRASASGR